MNLQKKRLPIAMALFVLLGSLIIHGFSANPVLASTDDDVRTLTQIEMNNAKITGVNPESVALAERPLADTTTFVSPTGLVKHLEKDAILAHVRKEATETAEATDLKISLAVSDVQVHLYGDTAIVTYQKQLKQFTSSDSSSALMSNLIGHSFSSMDTFIKRNGEWKVVATVAVSQSPMPDELYKAAKTALAQW